MAAVMVRVCARVCVRFTAVASTALHAHRLTDELEGSVCMCLSVCVSVSKSVCSCPCVSVCAHVCVYFSVLMTVVAYCTKCVCSLKLHEVCRVRDLPRPADFYP